MRLKTSLQASASQANSLLVHLLLSNTCFRSVLARTRRPSSVLSFQSIPSREGIHRVRSAVTHPSE